MNLQYRNSIDTVVYRSTQVAASTALQVLIPAWEEASASGGRVTVVEANADAAYGPAFNASVRANSALPEVQVEVMSDPGQAMSDISKGPIIQVGSETGLLSRLDADNGSGMVAIGDWSTDGWAGEKVQLVTVNPKCRTAKLTVEPSPWGPNILSATTSYPDGRVRQIRHVEVAAAPVELIWEIPEGPRARIDLAFSRTWVPAQMGTGDDLRHLANRLQFRCSP
jgi:hypothetical protein